MRWLLAVLVLFSGFAHSHRSHFGWTEINLNADTVEIVHRFHEHDAALLVSKLTHTAADITKIESQARFALYLEQQFFIASPTEQIPLNLIGAELKGKYLFVYQEASAGEIGEQITIEVNAMMDLFDGQIHLVNIKLPGIVQTLEFSKGSKPQTLSANQATNQTTSQVTKHADTY